MGVSGQHHRSAAFSSGKRPGTHCSEGWVGPTAGLDIQVTRQLWSVTNASKLESRSELQR
jgi:hypothetical protein